MRQVLLTLYIGVTASGCGGGASDAPASAATAPAPTTVAAPNGPARPYAQSDLEVAQLIYADSHRTPTGFYSEPATGTTYTSTTHLKNTDVATEELGENTARHELCTDDWNQALEWSETAANKMPSYGDLAATNSEPRFFEFVRVPRATPTAQARQRVFRCSYLDRTGTDLEIQNGEGGRINQRPLTATQLQQLAEYLWQFTVYNNFGNVVLTSATTTAQAGTLAHELIIATLERATTSANCDRIVIVSWKHTVDAVTGDITRTTTALGTLRARENNRQVTLCEAP